MAVGLACYDYFRLKRDEGVFLQEALKNKVSIQSHIPLTVDEIDQITKSVDEFMNEYKLPGGGQYSYTILVEQKLNNSLKIVVNPEETGDIGNIVLYARRTNDIWQLDPRGGPWCSSLEEFEQGDCL